MLEGGRAVYGKRIKPQSPGRILARTSDSARETRKFGADLAARLQPGDCVLISGPLGAGKTVLVRGALESLGVRGAVASPTFTFVHEVWGKDSDGRKLPIAHLDFYRLTVPAAERGLLDYLDGKYMVFVEWPERDKSFWPRRAIRARIAILPGGRRAIRAAFPGRPRAKR